MSWGMFGLSVLVLLWLLVSGHRRAAVAWGALIIAVDLFPWLFWAVVWAAGALFALLLVLLVAVSVHIRLRPHRQLRFLVTRHIVPERARDRVKVRT